MTFGPSQNQKLAQEIGEALRALPGVRDVRIFYHGGDPSKPPAVMATITVAPDADIRYIADEFERRVWTSSITPLSSFSATLTDGERSLGATGPSTQRVAEYTAKWGPRPV